MHHSHGWHQDGSLGLDIPLSSAQPYLDSPFNHLIPCWLPLSDCGVQSPSLQFITQPLKKPLHFNYLNEENLRKMFAEKDFYSAELNIGDVVIFLKGTLHKTHVNSRMDMDRMSLEFRVFQDN